MSPNSSSTCLSGTDTRSAALRTISPCPFLGLRYDAPTNSTRCTTLRQQPVVGHHCRDADEAPPPLVSWPHVRGRRKGFLVIPRRAREARRRTRASAAARMPERCGPRAYKRTARGGVRRRRAYGRRRTGRHIRREDRPRKLSHQPGHSPPDELRARGQRTPARTWCRTSP